MNKSKAIAVLIALFTVGGILFWKLQDTTSPILISNPRALVADGAKSFPVFFSLENKGGGDTLVGVKIRSAKKTMFMGAAFDNKIAIPAGSKPRFSVDGTHIMATGLDKVPGLGTFIPMVLTFEKAGKVSAKVLVVKSSVGGASDMNDHSMHGRQNFHDVSNDMPKPSITLTAARVPETDEWELKISTKNFEFYPDDGQAQHVEGAGHAHLYVDGLKLDRVYQNTVTVGALPKGKHVFAISLNTNDHRFYAVDGKVITAEATVEIE